MNHRSCLLEYVDVRGAKLLFVSHSSNVIQKEDLCIEKGKVRLLRRYLLADVGIQQADDFFLPRSSAGCCIVTSYVWTMMGIC